MKYKMILRVLMVAAAFVNCAIVTFDLAIYLNRA
jgi:hypothetical protein